MKSRKSMPKPLKISMLTDYKPIDIVAQMTISSVCESAKKAIGANIVFQELQVNGQKVTACAKGSLMRCTLLGINCPANAISLSAAQDLVQGRKPYVQSTSERARSVGTPADY